MTIWSWIGIGLGGTAAVVAAVIAAFRVLYVKVPANMAFVRTGLGGRKVATEAGAMILPFVHNIQWLSLETFKIDILKKDREAFITRDRYRVDIGTEFYVKIAPEAEMIEAASRSLGDKSFSADGIKQLVEEKLVSAMRSSAAQMELVELHENRRQFALAVKDMVSQPLAHNGLGLEDVAVFSLDQTDKSQLEPNNIFDAEGLRQITAQTSARLQERNEIERNTEVAIKRKDVEAVRVKLELDREQQFAEAEQKRQVENHRIEQSADSDRFRFAQEQQSRETEIGKERQIREAELARELHLIEKEQERDLAGVLREQKVEEAKRQKEIAVLQHERKRIAEEASRLEAEARREKSEQAVATVAQCAEAERSKAVALIRALNELEVAERRASATERLARAKLADGESEAKVTELLRKAENAVDAKLLYREVALRLIERMPEIANALMEPARHIGSIRVLDVNGLGGANGGAADSGRDPVGRVFEALLGTSAALPIVKELLAFGESNGLLDKMQETLPGLNKLVEPPKPAAEAS